MSRQRTTSPMRMSRGSSRQPHAALRATNAFDVAGGGELLQHLRHMVARHVEMISDLRRAQNFRLPVRQKDKSAQPIVREVRQSHEIILSRYRKFGNKRDGGETD